MTEEHLTEVKVQMQREINAKQADKAMEVVRNILFQSKRDVK
jgi:hypothetical protein